MKRSLNTPTILRFVLVSGVCAGAIGLAGRPAVPGNAQPAASWTWPVAVGVGAESSVYVGFAGWAVSRLSSGGEWLGSWRTDGPMDDLAVGPEGAVFTVMDKSNRVYRFLSDGTPDGQWQAGSHVIAVAAEPSDGAEPSSSVYVLWRPQLIGEPPSGPPRVTRYTSRGEWLGEWEVDASAHDLTVSIPIEVPEGIILVAAAGSIGRYAPDGTAFGTWSARVAGRGRIAAGLDGSTYVASQPSPDESSEVWHYSHVGVERLVCASLPAEVPRDIAVDSSTGDIYVLFPDMLLKLDPECAELARFSLGDLSGAPADTPRTPVPGTPGTAGTPAASPSATLPSTETPHPTPTAPAPASPTPLPEPPMPGEPPPMFFHFDGIAYEAAIGTYCWLGCVDAAGPITPPDPVRIGALTPSRLEVSASPSIESVHMMAFPARMEDAREITSGHWKGDLVWHSFRGPRIELPVLPVRDQTIALELGPGLHVLDFTVNWDGWGDASYGMLVDVEDRESLFLPWVNTRLASTRFSIGLE